MLVVNFPKKLYKNLFLVLKGKGTNFKQQY
jgi:hypothetical protein